MHIPALMRGAAVAALLSCSTAPAQTAASGFELERLELNTGRGSLLAGNGELLVPGGVSAGLVGHYQHLPLVLRNGGERMARVRHRASTVLAGSYGVLPWLEVGAQLPVVLWQQGGDSSHMGLPPLTAHGLGTPVLQARLGLLSLRQEQPVDLSVDLGAGLPVGSPSALARDPGMRFRARVTVGRRWGWLEPALDAGVLLRPSNPLSGTASTNLIPELRLGAGVAVTHKGLRGELAIRSAFSMDTRSPSIEVLGGVRMPLPHGLELFALGGPGLGTAPGTPTARVLLGLGFHTEPPPGLERLTETIPRFRLEPELLASREEAPRQRVMPVPTRELLPAEAPAANTTPLLQGSVLFEPGRAELPGDLSLLQAVLMLLRSRPGESVVVLEGHAGQEGSETADRLLPLKRAQAVRNYLAGQGVPPANLRVRRSEGQVRTPRVEVFVSTVPAPITREVP
ncbi:OmpA family protein [Archangium violaceum]|uniref:OmpA family protein n=1 Tax=Archangium violaceum TaxID=83451 RepID=UPI00194EEB92|nr:OmpA family protein [Archangium violaceum]QRO01034.1 OmpA family protein [Archangium violaceum]